MAKQPVIVFGYELWTTKFTGNSVKEDRFDFELLDTLLKKILEVPIKERAFKNKKKNKSINLLSYKDSDDSDLVEGVFSTARYGKEQKIIDIPDQTEAGLKGKNQGVLSQVNFIIDKATGLLLVEKDSEGVARRQLILGFLKYHKGLIYDYIEQFNKQFSPNKIHKNNFVSVKSLPPKTFFEDIKDFASIKDAYYYKDINQDDNKNNEASNFMYQYQKADKEGMKGVTRVKVSFENTLRGGSVRHVEKFFKKLFEAQNYDALAPNKNNEYDDVDGFGASGRLQSGRTRTIELENIQRAFDVSVEHSEGGIPSVSDLIEQMVYIAKHDNPLEYKRGIEQFTGVNLNEEEDGKEDS
ncbi:hypothetical protein SAMN04489762_1059 [Terribacillus saccharophilus]|uniref:CRISPR-associated protein n=1 Tax=Terribacillus saccharophilus TaxID=361277 RepID=A0AAX2EDB7_9BACI|nr:hypothetical protein SAMN04489762_1059 [Terribacillus saccharophilus]